MHFFCHGTNVLIFLGQIVGEIDDTFKPDSPSGNFEFAAVVVSKKLFLLF